MTLSQAQAVYSLLNKVVDEAICYFDIHEYFSGWYGVLCEGARYGLAIAGPGFVIGAITTAKLMNWSDGNFESYDLPNPARLRTEALPNEGHILY